MTKRKSNRVVCEIKHIESECSAGFDIPAVKAICAKCNHSTESFGNQINSIKRCLVMLRDECPNQEGNFYAMENEEEYEQAEKVHAEKKEIEQAHVNKLENINQSISNMDEAMEDSPFKADRHMGEQCGMCQKQYSEELLMIYPDLSLCKGCASVVISRLQKFLNPE